MCVVNIQSAAWCGYTEFVEYLLLGDANRFISLLVWHLLGRSLTLLKGKRVNIESP